MGLGFRMGRMGYSRLFNLFQPFHYFSLGMVRSFVEFVFLLHVGGVDQSPALVEVENMVVRTTVPRDVRFFKGG